MFSYLVPAIQSGRMPLESSMRWCGHLLIWHLSIQRVIHVGNLHVIIFCYLQQWLCWLDTYDNRGASILCFCHKQLQWTKNKRSNDDVRNQGQVSQVHNEHKSQLELVNTARSINYLRICEALIQIQVIWDCWSTPAWTQLGGLDEIRRRNRVD